MGGKSKFSLLSGHGGDAVFKNLAMRVKLDKKPEADTPVDAFVEDLKKIPCLHFAAITEAGAEAKQ